jgi:hypothetical protein
MATAGNFLRPIFIAGTSYPVGAATIDDSLVSQFDRDTFVPGTEPDENLDGRTTSQIASDAAAAAVAAITGWDDLRFPAQGINPPGAASDPAVNTTTGLLGFSGTADNIIAGVAQMPHSWIPGTAVRPHLHLRFPTSASANSRWKLVYDVADGATPFVNNYGTYTDGGTITVANPQDAKAEVPASFSEVSMSGLLESAVIMWRITRLAATDAADTDTSAAVLLEFDIHYQSNKLGTQEEIPS